MEKTRSDIAAVGAEFSGRPTETVVYEFKRASNNKLVDFNGDPNQPTFDDLCGRGWSPLHWDFKRDENKYTVVMQRLAAPPSGRVT